MGKQKKSTNPGKKKLRNKNFHGELLKKPYGMSKVLFKDIVWLLAKIIKQKYNQEK